MIVNMTLELEDKPGQLLNALEPISERGGNIVSINHQRGKVTPRGTLPVEIDFEVVEERLDLILDDLREYGVRIAEIGEEKFQKSTTLILVGDRKNVNKLIDKIEEKGVKVVNLSVEIPEKGDKSSTRLTINAISEEKLKDAMDSVRNFCEKKDILEIEPVSI